jgi:hypothetical protein
MTKDRKTVYVNDQPVQIFLWAEVQHCVNAYDSDLFLTVQRGDAEILDVRGDRIGWGGFAGDGQHIYVRSIRKGETTEPSLLKDSKTVYVNDESIQIFQWAEVHHCVNAYNSDLFLAVKRGEAEIFDEMGNRISMGGFVDDGKHIYVRPITKGEDN